MSQSEKPLRSSLLPADFDGTKFPNRLVAVVIALAFLPITLNLLGISFSAAEDPGIGEVVDVLLEWTACMIALATVVFAMSHYFVVHDVTTPIISTALFFSGMIDGFQSLATVHLLPFTAEGANFIPFTWTVSRLANVVFLIAGTIPFVWDRGRAAPRRQEKELPFLILTAVLFALMAYVIVFLCATSGRLPQAYYPEASIVHRPWDLIPLFLYLFAGSVVFPRFYRAQPSVFSHALFISVIPSVAAQLHAAFGSVALYDNNFNIASFHKIIAYLVPFLGLLLDYGRAYHAGVALQVTQEKLRVARDVQRGLLPQSSPVIDGYDIAGWYEATDLVGGDYFDYVHMADGRLGIVVADVSGHELGASLLMAKTRAYLRALVQSDADLSTQLGRLHHFLMDDVQDKWFVTMFYVALDLKDGTLEYAGAAQQAHIVRADGRITYLKSTSTPLGVFADRPPRCAPPVVLEPGDLLLVSTDGLIEAKSPSGEQFGQDRALDIVRENRGRPSEEILAALNREMGLFCCAVRPADDVTIVVARRTGVAAS
jgi:hypothetical protein